jgi:PAS domain S-box-containing protein
MVETAYSKTGAESCNPLGTELADFASESVIVYDPDGVIRYWNPASERFYGWAASATVGRHFRDFAAPGIHYAAHWNAIPESGHWEGTMQRKTAAGRVVYAYVRQIARRDRRGGLKDLVEYGRLIVPRTSGRPHEAVSDIYADQASSEDRYHKLLRNMPTALWQVDARYTAELFAHLRAEGIRDLGAYLDAHPEVVDLVNDNVVVTAANRSAVALMRAREAAELVGPIRYLVGATPELTKRVMVARYEGRRSYTEETKVMTFDGCVRDVAFSATYPAPPENLETTFITLEDITDRLRTHAQLRKLQLDHERAARISTLGKLTACIAHEVKQPLAAIVTNAETSLRWLAKEDINIEKVRYLNSRIISGAIRASEIVQRVQRMAAKSEAVRVPLHVADVVGEAISFVRDDIDAKGIVLEVSFDSGLPAVLGDRVQLQQVIVNLLINSIQAISQAHSVRRMIRLTGSASSGRDRVTISVHDSGPGISEDNLSHIFESFFTTKAGGMGIGLALCHSIATEHGGQIQASNHPTGGALFQLSLPAAPTASHLGAGI